MTRGNENALNLNGVTAPNAQTKGNDRNTYQGETTMNQITSVPAATDKDWAGHTVATAAGFIVQPDSLLMRSITNGDNPAAFAARGRYFVTAPAPTSPSAWDRCSGSSSTD